MVRQPSIGGSSLTYFGFTGYTHTGNLTARSLSGTNLASALPRVGLLFSSVSATSVAGSRTNEYRYYINQHTGFFFKNTFGRAGITSTQTTHEAFIGLTNLSGGNGITDVSIRSYPNAFYGIGVEAGDVNLQFIYCLNASTDLVKIDLGSSFPKSLADDSEILELIITGNKAISGNQTLTLLVTNLSNGISATVTVPSTYFTYNLGLTFRQWIRSNGGTSNLGINMHNIYSEFKY